MTCDNKENNCEPQNYFDVKVLLDENGQAITKAQFESIQMVEIDNKGSEVFWNDLGRP